MESSPETWIKLANTVGFPIWVAVFLLVRLDRTLREMTAAVTKLTVELRAQKGD